VGELLVSVKSVCREVEGGSEGGREGEEEEMRAPAVVVACVRGCGCVCVEVCEYCVTAGGALSEPP
jgi:hypothetical protein